MLTALTVSVNVSVAEELVPVEPSLTVTVMFAVPLKLGSRARSRSAPVGVDDTDGITLVLSLSAVKISASPSTSEATRAIVGEMSSSVAWGPIGDKTGASLAALTVSVNVSVAEELVAPDPSSTVTVILAVPLKSSTGVRISVVPDNTAVTLVLLLTAVKSNDVPTSVSEALRATVVAMSSVADRPPIGDKTGAALDGEMEMEPTVTEVANVVFSTAWDTSRVSGVVLADPVCVWNRTLTKVPDPDAAVAVAMGIRIRPSVNTLKDEDQPCVRAPVVSTPVASMSSGL